MRAKLTYLKSTEPPTTETDEETTDIPAIWLFELRAESKLLYSPLACFDPEFPEGAAPPLTTTEPGAIEVIVIAFGVEAPMALAKALMKLK